MKIVLLLTFLQLVNCNFKPLLCNSRAARPMYPTSTCRTYSVLNYWSLKEDSIQYCFQHSALFDSTFTRKELNCYIPKESSAFDSFCAQINSQNWKNTFASKIDAIISICQGIQYITDQRRFGKEVNYSPEYLLVQGVGDCEDKSVLCARLIEKVLQFKTVLISYPEEKHMNIGVLIPKGYEFFTEPNQSIETIDYQGEKYTIIEPVTWGYPVGMQLEGIVTTTTQKSFLKLEQKE
jgi:hypothetical protein